jgi:hypothetical protein
MSAWGNECDLWDDSVDWATIDKESNDIQPEGECVMTTWHENETLEEAAGFFMRHGSNSIQRLDATLIVNFSVEESEALLRDVFLKV